MEPKDPTCRDCGGPLTVSDAPDVHTTATECIRRLRIRAAAADGAEQALARLRTAFGVPEGVDIVATFQNARSELDAARAALGVPSGETLGRETQRIREALNLTMRDSRILDTVRSCGVHELKTILDATRTVLAAANNEGVVTRAGWLMNELASIRNALGISDTADAAKVCEAIRSEVDFALGALSTINGVFGRVQRLRAEYLGTRDELARVRNEMLFCRKMLGLHSSESLTAECDKIREAMKSALRGSPLVTVLKGIREINEAARSADTIVRDVRRELGTPEGTDVRKHAGDIAKALGADSDNADCLELILIRASSTRSADNVLDAVRSALNTPQNADIIRHAARLVSDLDQANARLALIPLADTALHAAKVVDVATGERLDALGRLLGFRPRGHRYVNVREPYATAIRTYDAKESDADYREAMKRNSPAVHGFPAPATPDGAPASFRVVDDVLDATKLTALYTAKLADWAKGVPISTDAGRVLRGPFTAPDTGRKDDKGKARFDLVPWGTITAVAKVLAFGADKYGAENWRKVDNARNRYFAAAMRHLIAWMAGERKDADTGESPLAHVICCALFLDNLPNG